MIQLFIRPVDTQFHRSGLPFDAGQSIETDSFFPPFPRTLYGALRTLGMSLSESVFGFDADFKPGTHGEVFGGRDSFGSLRILGPVLARMDGNGKLNYSLCFPMPLDLVMEKETENLVLLSPLDPSKKPLEAGWSSRQPGLSFIVRCDGQDPFTGEVLGSLNGDCFLPWSLLIDYLLHDHQALQRKKKGDCTSIDDLFRSEPRTGIVRDSRTRTAAESMLYSVRHYRMNDQARDTCCGLLVCVEQDGGVLGQAGLLQLGGDFRAAGITPLTKGDTDSWWKEWEQDVCEKIVETGRFKAFFITPALFRKGCIPDCIQDCRIIKEAGFELKSACIGKPRPVGGWNIQKKEPKPLRKAVPEGSVYFFKADKWGTLSREAREATAAKIMELYNFKTWCLQEPWPDGSEYGPGKEGFGIALIGGW